MKIELSVSEASLLLEIVRDWKKTRPYRSVEGTILNGIANKIHDSVYQSSASLKSSSLTEASK